MSCPAWCKSDHSDDAADYGSNVHYHRAEFGNLAVSVEERDGATVRTVVEVGSVDMTAEQARLYAADLLAVAELADAA